MHTCIVDSGRYAYAVFYSDLRTDLANAGAMLGNVRDGNARGGRVVEDKEFTISGNPGKAVTIEKDGALIFNRIILVKNRLYQVMLTMNKSDDLPESANTFIRSFRVSQLTRMCASWPRCCAKSRACPTPT